MKDELTFKVVTQIGGTFNAVAVDGNTVYLGIGPRFATVDISDPASPRLLWQSEVLPDVAGAIAVQPGQAYLRVGTELLIYDVSDPALPSMVGTMSGVSGDLFPYGGYSEYAMSGDHYDPVEVREAFHHLSEYGYNTVRIFSIYVAAFLPV